MCRAGATFDLTSLSAYRPTTVDQPFGVVVAVVISSLLVFRAGPLIVGNLSFLCGFLLAAAVDR